MLVYSKKIIKFVHTLKGYLKEVISLELGLRIEGDRFFDTKGRFSYPIKPVIFNHRKMLGYFDPDFYELGFHESLMQANQERLKNIIRHELAHYMTFINYQGRVKPHGDEFKAFCLGRGWGEEVYKATTCVEDPLIKQVEENSVLRKVKKLMALATSSNNHEAEQAMIKSQQLLLNHNIDLSSVAIEGDEEKFFLKRILRQPKKDAKMKAIARILETFFVNSVYNRVGGFTCLEVVGSGTNVEIAEYVATILQSELDNLWNRAKKEQLGLKGIVAKNSFFRGVAKGYCNKINFLKKQYDNNTSTVLSVIEKKLEEASALVYEKLSTVRSRASDCSYSSHLGEQAGKGLQINPGIKNYSNNLAGSLTYQD